MRSQALASLFLAAAPTLFARVDFNRDVKPILEYHCVRCHGPDRAMKNLRLDYKRRALMAIVPRKPDESRIYNAMKTDFMPPTPRKLTPAELDTIRKWITEGARWPTGVELTGKNPFVEEKAAR